MQDQERQAIHPGVSDPGVSGLDSAKPPRTEADPGGSSPGGSSPGGSDRRRTPDES